MYLSAVGQCAFAVLCGFGLVPLRVKRRRKSWDSAKRKIKNDLGLIPRSPPKMLHRYETPDLGYLCGIYSSLAPINRCVSALISSGFIKSESLPHFPDKYQRSN